MRKAGVDLNEARKKAREEAAIAKAAGFEWVNVSVQETKIGPRRLDSPVKLLWGGGEMGRRCVVFGTNVL